MPLSSDQTGAITKQFDPMRRRLQQQETANLQGQRDVLQRRSAQLGGGPSGALVKQEQMASDASARRLVDANAAVNAQESATLNQAREAQAGRDFARSERLGSQKFASGESALQRKFLTGERLGTQKWQTGERIGSQDFASSQAEQNRIYDASKFGQQMAFEGERFAHEKDVDAFNMDLATKMLEKKDILEQMLAHMMGGGGGGPFGMGGSGYGRYFGPNWVSGGGVDVGSDGVSVGGQKVASW